MNPRVGPRILQWQGLRTLPHSKHKGTPNGQQAGSLAPAVVAATVLLILLFVAFVLFSVFSYQIWLETKNNCAQHSTPHRKKNKNPIKFIVAPTTICKCLMVLSSCRSNKRKEDVIQDQNYEGKKRVASFSNSVSTKTSD
jgi:hypothetical protein